MSIILIKAYSIVENVKLFIVSETERINVLITELEEKKKRLDQVGPFH